MIALIGLLPIYVFWFPNILWKMFDMFIGGVQAFIFALLTILYFGMAAAGHGDAGDEHEEHAHEPESGPAPDEADELGQGATPTPALAR
jgi:F-type H+-transporting ATPase subunit a